MSHAHPLKPVLHIGKEGISDASAHALRDAFNTRELLKVKVLENAPEPPRETGEALARQVEDVQVVRVIGRIVVLYRAHPDQPKLALPR